MDYDDVATIEITKLQAENKRLKEALQWCNGSGDFAPDGKAHKGWEKICRPLLVDPD